MRWEDHRRTIAACKSTVARHDLAERYAARTIDRFELRTAVGGGMRRADLYRAVPYKEAFSPALVETVLDHVGVHSGRLVDPFVGSGTSVLVAAERGLTGVGVDVLPYSAFVTNTLLRAPECNWDLVEKQANAVTARQTRRRGTFPDFPVREWAFNEAALAGLSEVRDAIGELEPAIESDVLRLALLSSIEQLSQSAKDGTSLRRRPPGRGRPGRYGTVHTRRDVTSVFHAKLELLRSGALGRVRSPRHSTAVVGDARDVDRILCNRRRFDVAVFSPPYPNRYDYVGNYQLELGFGFVDSGAELKALRKAQLRSHLEAPWSGDRSVVEPALDEFLAAYLASEHRGTEGNRVVRMVSGYFEDMALVLKGLRRVLHPGAPVAAVVGTQVFGGEPLPTDLILASVAESLGYETKEVWVARAKGVAVQQRRVITTPVGSREAVLILEA